MLNEINDLELLLNGDEDDYLFSAKSINPYPQLKLLRRFYQIPYSSTEDSFHASLPDFKELARQWFININTYQRMTMGWGIVYSRLNVTTKTRLLKKYYKDDVYDSFFKIGRRIKSVQFLEWLQEADSKPGK